METSSQLQAPAALPQEKNIYPLKRRLNGPQIRSVYFGEEKNLLPLPGCPIQYSD
jgi:hypothetical protein